MISIETIRQQLDLHCMDGYPILDYPDIIETLSRLSPEQLKEVKKQYYELVKKHRADE